MKKELYDTYVQILKDELLPAMGCTEPIAIAYAGAIARETLGCIPDRVEIEVSRNIIKNVKSVIVPHTGGLRGIEAAAAIGIIAGNAKRQLEVISSVTEQEIEETRKYLEETALHVDFSKSPLIFDIGITVFHGEEQAYVRIVDYHTNVVTIRHNEEETALHVDFSKSPLIFDIGITVFHGEEQAYVRIVDYHTNVVTIRHNDQTILSAEITGRTETSMADKSTLTIRDICEFAEIVKIEDVQAVLDRQISYNMAISTEGIQNSYGANIGRVLIRDICEFAEIVKIEDVQAVLDRQISYNMAISTEGIQNSYGANIGRVLLHTYGEDDVKIRAKAMAAAGSDARMNGCELPVVINSGSGNQGITVSVPVITYANDVKIRAKAMAAAGSDARMNGCELPVVINSGSGNQGITVSVPVITYAKELNVSEEDLYRALVVSNLSTLHIKEGIGRLSAYCGAVGAGCGAGAGIAWLHGGRYKEIAHTLVNSLAILSGTICDGAKASCAAKIAAAVDAGILGYFMYKDGQQFIDGDGIVKKDVENTIRCVGLLASEGMQETDKEIVHLMISKEVCQ